MAYSAGIISHIDSGAAVGPALSDAPRELAKFEICPVEINLSVMELVSFFLV